MKKFLSVILVLILCFSLAQPVFAADVHRGIDVSQWQGDIDYSRVRDAGIRVVYIKAGEGSRFVDPYFERNYRGARDARLDIGFYHFVTARSVDEGRRQARFFATLVNEKNMECRPAMDFEEFGDLSRREINRIARAYMEELERLTGFRPMLYSDASNAENLWDRRLSRYPLWVADYGRDEPYTTGPWRTWTGFQYSDRGRIDGIDGLVDLDRFKDGAYLRREERVRERPLVYEVRRGDTLSQIARRFDTTVERIATLNRLENPNLIFPGEKLIIRREAR